MRLRSVLLISGLLLIGAGCFKATPQPQLSDTPARQSDNLSGDLEISAIEIDKSFILNEVADCRVHISYPNLNSLDLPDTVTEQANQMIAAFVARTLGADDNNNDLQDIERLADNYLDQCGQEITTEYTTLSPTDDELYINLKRSVDIVYDVRLNQSSVLSLGLNAYSYLGGAHPNHSFIYLNLDLSGNQLLSLGQLIKSEHLQDFVQYEKQLLLTNQRDNLYPERIQEFEAIISDQTNLSPEDQTSTYAKWDSFFLTPTSLITYYNTYDIAPYIAGPITVEIPYTDIADYLLPNSPLQDLVE